MYAEYQQDLDELEAFVKEGEESDLINNEGVASGPSGHLYVAVSNLIDYANAETTTEDEAEKALKIAKQVKDLR